MGSASEIVEFWFGEALGSPDELDRRSKLWFARDDDFDREIERRFAELPARAARGELDAWRSEAGSTLALLLVLDQFPRNLYRNSARAFEFDAPAREITLEAISRGFDRALHPLQASFLYLPLEHAEDPVLQRRCVELFEALLERAPASARARFEEFVGYAERHRDVIERFGRFPHRNEALGRSSTPEEVAYLESGGDRF